jgi:hypothetical protein
MLRRALRGGEHGQQLSNQHANEKKNLPDRRSSALKD